MDQPVELQVTYWLSLLRRRAKLLIACLIGGAFLGLVAGALGSSSYTAKTTVLLQTPLTDPNANSTPSTGFQSLAQLATSDLVKHDASAVLSGSPKLAVSVSSDNPVVTFAATAPKAADAATAA